jgi:hypothetical protein
VATGRCNLERFGFFTLFVNMNQLSRLYPERGTINSLPVDQNVTVNNELSSLRDGASKT